MRGLYLLVLLVLLLPTSQYGLSSLPSGPEVQTASSLSFGSDGDVLLSEVSPSRPSEHIILENRGGPIDLHNWTLTDGEGSVRLLDLSLRQGERLGVAADPAAFSLLHPAVRCIGLSSDDVTCSGRFALADAGDAVQLLDAAGGFRDSVYYGAAPDPLEGWWGAAVAPVTKGHAVVRLGPDTDTAADWTIEPPGRSAFPAATFPASVEPFTAPEEARDRVLREVALAAFSLRVAVYEISDPAVVSALAQRSREGVEVKVLAEGQPVAGLDDDCAAALSALAGSGCEVRVLASSNGYKRYDYLHCKYLVADGRRALVMSENWAGGLSGNRGWGAVCDGRELAGHLAGLFEEDFGGALDTRSVEAGSALSAEVPSLPVLPYRRHLAEVAPLVSPDNAEGQYLRLVREARERVLVQLLYVQEDWTVREGLLSELVAAAARGVQVRVLLDATWSRAENLRVAEHLNDAGERGGWDLQAKLISPYHGLGVMHNKGMVADGTAVVSSLNWGDTALRDNREVGLAIRSAEVSEYFAGVFWTDWSDDPFPPSLTLSWHQCTVQEGVPVLIDASSAADASGVQRIEFDLGNDGTVEWTGRSWTVLLPPGLHTVAVTAHDRFNNSATEACTIEVVAGPADRGLPPLLLIALAPLLLFPFLKRIMHMRGH